MRIQKKGNVKQVFGRAVNKQLLLNDPNQLVGFFNDLKTFIPDSREEILQFLFQQLHLQNIRNSEDAKIQILFALECVKFLYNQKLHHQDYSAGKKISKYTGILEHFFEMVLPSTVIKYGDPNQQIVPKLKAELYSTNHPLLRSNLQNAVDVLNKNFFHEDHSERYLASENPTEPLKEDENPFESDSIRIIFDKLKPLIVALDEKEFDKSFADAQKTINVKNHNNLTNISLLLIQLDLEINNIQQRRSNDRLGGDEFVDLYADLFSKFFKSADLIPKIEAFSQFVKILYESSLGKNHFDRSLALTNAMMLRVVGALETLNIAPATLKNPIKQYEELLKKAKEKLKLLNVVDYRYGTSSLKSIVSAYLLKIENFRKNEKERLEEGELYWNFLMTVLDRIDTHIDRIKKDKRIEDIQFLIKQNIDFDKEYLALKLNKYTTLENTAANLGSFTASFVEERQRSSSQAVIQTSQEHNQRKKQEIQLELEKLSRSAGLEAVHTGINQTQRLATLLLGFKTRIDLLGTICPELKVEADALYGRANQKDSNYQIIENELQSLYQKSFYVLYNQLKFRQYVTTSTSNGNIRSVLKEMDKVFKDKRVKNFESYVVSYAQSLRTIQDASPIAPPKAQEAPSQRKKGAAYGSIIGGTGVSFFSAPTLLLLGVGSLIPLIGLGIGILGGLAMISVGIWQARKQNNLEMNEEHLEIANLFTPAIERTICKEETFETVLKDTPALIKNEFCKQILQRIANHVKGIGSAKTNGTAIEFANLLKSDLTSLYKEGRLSAIPNETLSETLGRWNRKVDKLVQAQKEKLRSALFPAKIEEVNLKIAGNTPVTAANNHLTTPPDQPLSTAPIDTDSHQNSSGSSEYDSVASGVVHLPKPSVLPATPKTTVELNQILDKICNVADEGQLVKREFKCMGDVNTLEQNLLANINENPEYDPDTKTALIGLLTKPFKEIKDRVSIKGGVDIFTKNPSPPPSPTVTNSDNNVEVSSGIESADNNRTRALSAT